MEHFKRLLLLAVTITVGGVLGYKLLSDLEPVKYVVFIVAVLILGEVFYRIDKNTAIRTGGGVKRKQQIPVRRLKRRGIYLTVKLSS